MASSETYDFIIVGAGSAGCVLANRLSADPSNRVLLLEHGGSDRSVFIQMPSALSIPMNMARYNWGFESEPEPWMDNRRLDCPRGKVVGGSSSINGMVYVRGHGCDFDEWEEYGAAGWGYRHCLPYFRRAESWADSTATDGGAKNEAGHDAYRGTSGPLATSNGNGMVSPLYGAFIDAGREAGYLETADYNGFQQDGFGPMHMTVRGGVRASTANVYLKPVTSRRNLTVVTHALVERVLMEGTRAVGVRYHRDGGYIDVYAEAEVVLAAGSIGSPTVLQRSGIGPAHVLRNAGVDVRVSSPGVGANLQDHLEVYFQYRCLEPITLNGQLTPLRKAAIGARWLLFRNGLGATNHFEACGFVRSKAGVKWPDIQYHFLPGAIRYDGRVAFDGHGFQVHVGPNKPKSRGMVEITSRDPERHPRIRFNYMQHVDDIEAFRNALRITREIMLQPAMDPYRGAEIQPGEAIETDDALDAWIRQNAESAYHPSCTCKIGGDDDPDAVLDPACRVRGADSLRVVDSSVFPTITNGNLNAPTIMVAEKASDLILDREPLAASNAPYYVAPDWQQRQREGTPLRHVAQTA